MSRMEKRIRALEGGASDGVDIVAKVPDLWPPERQSAELRAILAAHGLLGPFGHIILIRDFSAREDSQAQVIFAGTFGMDTHPETPLTLANAAERPT